MKILRFIELTNVKDVGDVTEWFTHWLVFSGAVDQMAARWIFSELVSLCSSTPNEVPICWLEIHSWGRLVMQCEEACSVPLLTDEPCQPAPLNSSIFNYEIFGNKVQSQFTNNVSWHKRERERRFKQTVYSKKKKKKTTRCQLAM